MKDAIVFLLMPYRCTAAPLSKETIHREHKTRQRERSADKSRGEYLPREAELDVSLKPILLGSTKQKLNARWQISSSRLRKSARQLREELCVLLEAGHAVPHEETACKSALGGNPSSI